MAYKLTDDAPMNINNLSYKSWLMISLLPLMLNQPVIASATTSVSYYIDDRDFNSITLQLSAADLPQDFSVWGFTDFLGDQSHHDERKDFTRTFSEYRLSNSKLSKLTGIDGLGLQIEYDDATPNYNNTIWRNGLTYKHKLNGKHWLQLRAMPLQNNKDRQISLIYFASIMPRLNISGFADYNIRHGNGNQWVIEPQLNFRLLNKTWLLLEYRHNGFEQDNINLDGKGWAIGIRYDL